MFTPYLRGIWVSSPPCSPFGQAEAGWSAHQAANAGGDVLIGGPAGAIARSIAKVFQIWIINLTGASQTNADQRNFLGCSTIIDILSAQYGPVFWHGRQWNHAKA